MNGRSTFGKSIDRHSDRAFRHRPAPLRQVRFIPCRSENLEPHRSALGLSLWLADGAAPSDAVTAPQRPAFSASWRSGSQHAPCGGFFAVTMTEGMATWAAASCEPCAAVWRTQCGVAYRWPWSSDAWRSAAVWTVLTGDPAAPLRRNFGWDEHIAKDIKAAGDPQKRRTLDLPAPLLHFFYFNIMQA